MVTLPKNFVATRFPGYFWNTVELKLYSIKVTGQLRPLKFSRGGTFHGRQIKPGYSVSVNGVRRLYPLDQLEKLTTHTYPQKIETAK